MCALNGRQISLCRPDPAACAAPCRQGTGLWPGDDRGARPARLQGQRRHPLSCTDWKRRDTSPRRRSAPAAPRGGSIAPRLRAFGHSPQPSSGCTNFLASCSRTRKAVDLGAEDNVAGGAAMRRWVGMAPNSRRGLDHFGSSDGWPHRVFPRRDSEACVP